MIEAALSSCFRHPRKTLVFGEMEELCCPPIAEAKATQTRTVKLRPALARQPLEPARTEVRLVEAGSSMIRRLRFLSGLVMLAYVTTHLANHAVGLISLKAMEDVLWHIFLIWTNRPAHTEVRLKNTG